MKSPVLYPLPPRPAVTVYRRHRGRWTGAAAPVARSIFRTAACALLGILGAAAAAGLVAAALAPIIGWCLACVPAFCSAVFVLWFSARAADIV